VAYVPRGDGWAVGALNLGSDRTPAWCLNLQADPKAWVEVEGQRVQVSAREAAGAEADALWAALIEQFPVTAHSRRLARRHVPVMVLTPVSGQPERLA
jgi:deazaflavin-dependent oxidoreductase (nitroreductase family)